MSHLTVDNLEDYFDSAVEIFHKPGKPYITLDIDLNALPKGCEHIRIFLKSNDGSLKEASIVSQVEAGYATEDFEDEALDGEILSTAIGEAIINPDAAKEIADYYAKLKKSNGKSKS